MFEVIIIEDDPMVAMINKEYTSAVEGFHVARVSRDGLAALEYMKKNHVDLAILDIYMPQIDGLTLLRKIRHENLPVSVIMVTAANDAASVDEALRLGAIDYLVKPFSAARFQRSLKSFAMRRRALGEGEALNQRNIDSIFAAPPSSEELPKGIQEKTLGIICDFLDKNAELTNEEIADSIALSRVTVRRYMNYLLEKNLVSAKMNYDTGGRPSLLYKKA